MPRWVMNEVRLEGKQEEVKALLFAVCDETLGAGSIDFEKITPLPEDIDREDSDALLRSQKERWGVKWNANNDSAVLDPITTVLYFETAWKGVPALMYKLALMFPKLVINYRYADEDYGFNVGDYVFCGGGVKREKVYAELTAKSQAIAFELWDGDHIPLGYVWSDAKGLYVLDDED